MKALLLTISILLSVISLRAQNQSAASTEDDKIYTTPVEIMPRYKGGEEGLYFRLNHIRYLFIDRMHNVQGKVFVKFVVEKDGKVSNAEMIRGLTAEQDKEVLRVINNLRRFNPGMHNGKPVRVQLSIPIDFKMINV